MTINFSLNTVFSDAFWACLNGCNYIPIFSSNLASGTTDLYTVPSGKKAIIYRYFVYNDNGSSRTVQAQIKVSATYYATGENLSVSSKSFGFNVAYPIVFLEGETFAINTTGVGCNLWATVFEFSNSVPYTRSTLSNLASGNNTIYTCPAGKQAFPVNFQEFIFDNSAGGMTAMFYKNGTGGSVTFSRYFVKSGDSPTTNNLISSVTSSASTVFSGAIPNFSAGDSYVVNTSSASTPQLAWVNVIEVTA